MKIYAEGVPHFVISVADLKEKFLSFAQPNWYLGVTEDEYGFTILAKVKGEFEQIGFINLGKESGHPQVLIYDEGF